LLRFVLFEHLEVDKLVKYDAFRDFTRGSVKKTIDLTLKEALKVCREVMGPALQEGDQEGEQDALFYVGKVETCRYFCRNIMTNVFGMYKTFLQEDISALNVPEEVF